MKTLDEKRLERELRYMADAQVSMHLAVRRFPGFWVTQPLPAEMVTFEDAREYARHLAKKEGVKVGLTFRDSGTVWFDEKGRVVSRTYGGEK